MPVAKVNSLKTTQLQGLTVAQVSQIMNSPNYSLFSSAIKAYCQSVAYPSRSVTITVPSTNDNNSGGGNQSSAIRLSFLNIILNLIGISLVRTFF